MARVRSPEEIRREMQFVNDTEERKTAREIHAATRTDREPPISTSSSLALELKQREDDSRNERVIAATIEQDLETKAEEKPEESTHVTKKRLTRKVPQLDAKLAASNFESLFLKKLPSVAIDNVSSFLDNDLKTQAVLTRTCKRLRPFFQPALTEPRLKQLLQHIAYGQEDEAKKIIASNLNLLMMRGTAKDYSGNTIEDLTPLELAFGADDIDMCQMMLPYLDMLSGGREEALKQMQERFPESKEEEKPYDFAPLVAAITANNNVETALEKFREDFKPRVIRKGKHFNPQALLDAMQTYLNNYDSWSGEQCSLFWRQMVGYLQRMLPACYAQAFCQDLSSNVTNGKPPLKRSLKLVDGLSFYPDDPTSRVGVGFDFGIYAGEAVARVGMAIYCWAPPYFFSTLMSSKNISVEKLMQQPENPSNRCLIM